MGRLRAKSPRESERDGDGGWGHKARGGHGSVHSKRQMEHWESAEGRSCIHRRMKTKGKSKSPSGSDEL